MQEFQRKEMIEHTVIDGKVFVRETYFYNCLRRAVEIMDMRAAGEDMDAAEDKLRSFLKRYSRVRDVLYAPKPNDNVM